MCECAHAEGEWNLWCIDISPVSQLFTLLEFIRDYSFARKSLLINPHLASFCLRGNLSSDTYVTFT